MQLPPAVALAAIACVAMVVPALVVLLRSGSRARRPYRCGFFFLAFGATAAALTAAAPAVALMDRPEMIHHRHARMEFAPYVGAGFGVAAVLLVVGILFLPAVAGSSRARVRRFLDAFMVSAGIFFLVWALAIAPDQERRNTLLHLCGNAIVPAALALAVGGLMVHSTLWAPQPRAGAVLASSGIALLTSGGAGITGSLCYGNWGVFAWFSAACVLGLLLLAIGGGLSPRTPTSEQPDTWRSGLAVAMCGVLAIGVSALYSLIIDGRSPDVVSVVIATIEGLALLARQAVAFHDVRAANAKLALSEAHFRELAHTDPLTGLANRRGLLRVLENEAVGGPACTLLAIDLDGFKTVNDMRGHDVGDLVLVEVGQRLAQHLRPGDMAARLGGDEFAVLIWARAGEARGIAQRLLDSISAPYEQHNGSVFLSASVGLASCLSADSVAMLLRNADLALRYAKARGKARLELYEPEFEVKLRRRTTVGHELRGALERDELHLVFQPVVSLPSVRPVGVEALLRWHHPELGQVSPDEFIPIAEETGIIRQLGTWVLDQACRQLARWLADGHDVWASVNVSVHELHSAAYVQTVARVLRTHRVPAQRLVLEVTEHDVAVDIDELAERLADLRATGVRVALDDFGAGYSSLGQLHRLPVDILKIDRGLLMEPAPDPGIKTAPLVEVGVALGQRLGLTVIAEGVEEVAQRRMLEEARCPYAQGILFGRGMPAEHVEAMLAAASPRGPRPLLSAMPISGVPISGVPVNGNGNGNGNGKGSSGGREEDEWSVAQHVGPVDSGHEMRQA